MKKTNEKKKVKKSNINIDYNIENIKKLIDEEI